MQRRFWTQTAVATQHTHTHKETRHRANPINVPVVTSQRFKDIIFSFFLDSLPPNQERERNIKKTSWRGDTSGGTDGAAVVCVCGGWLAASVGEEWNRRSLTSFLTAISLRALFSLSLYEQPRSLSFGPSRSCWPNQLNQHWGVSLSPFLWKRPKEMIIRCQMRTSRGDS